MIHIFNGCRVIFVKPRNFMCHVQLVKTCEPSYISKFCLHVEFYRSENNVDKGPVKLIQRVKIAH